MKTKSVYFLLSNEERVKSPIASLFGKLLSMILVVKRLNPSLPPKSVCHLLWTLMPNHRTKEKEKKLNIVLLFFIWCSSCYEHPALSHLSLPHSEEKEDRKDLHKAFPLLDAYLLIRNCTTDVRAQSSFSVTMKRQKGENFGKRLN